jgi:hypothetical protein
LFLQYPNRRLGGAPGSVRERRHRSLARRVVAVRRATNVRVPLALAARDKDGLSRLVGETHGVVYTAGTATATLSIAGEAHGEVDDWPDDVELMLLLALAA